MNRIVRQLSCHLGLAASLLVLSACSSSGPLHVAVDPTLAAGDIYDVRGLTNRYWGKPVSFGNFSTKKTRVGETWASTTGSSDYGVGRRTHPLRFTFVGEGGEEWKVECRAKTPILRHADEHGEWEVPLGETRLGCSLQDPTGTRVHALTLAGSGELRGTTDVGGAPIEIRSLDTLVGRNEHQTLTLPAAIGYELRQDGRVLAGVDLLGRGRVYFARELPPELRTPVALTATVLMLFHESRS